MFSSDRRAALLLLAILALALLPGLGWAPLIDWDENIYGEAARQMVVRGDYLNVTINGQPFAEKPPLVLWEMAGMYRLFGVSAGTARLASAVNSVAFALLLFAIARRWLGQEAALLWALMQGTALIPIFLDRSSTIDPSFNALIGLGALCWVEYDRAWGRWREGRGSREYWLSLLGAAVAMALAVLSKGPLGGVVPLVAYGAYKLARRHPAVHLGHFIACGIVSLGIASSWFAVNWIVAGDEFLQRFAEFQGALFAKPLEGHTGPFYYHFAVALLGLFPWTPLLLLYAVPHVRRGVWAHPETRALAVMSLGWAGFVLVLFSLVQTKLPHYSSSMYMPLALLATLAAGEAMREGRRFPRWVVLVLAAYGALLSAALTVLPWLIGAVARQAGAGFAGAPEPSPWSVLPGVVLALGMAWATLAMARGALRRGVVIASCAMALTVLGCWRWQLPLVAAYNQGPVLALMQEAYASGGDLAFYRTLSFAAFFQGQREIEVLHSYKFRGDPTRLDRPGDRPLYVISPKTQVTRLLREHPGLQPVREMGNMAMYVRPATK